VKFSVLASGSRANCAVIEHESKLILIDNGLGPVLLKKRLESIGLSIDNVVATILTHTHCDHLNQATVRRLGVPVWCRAEHAEDFDEPADLHYYTDESFSPTDGVQVKPIHLFHDSPATHGFRIEADGKSIGYIADTGAWTIRMAKMLAGVDLLIIESNHDVDMQRTSDRPPSLIDRVLSNLGHLSNTQSAEFVRKITELGVAPKRIIAAHVSHSCNDDEKIRAAHSSDVVIATQDAATDLLEV
jgi:phosphoribosyl 1,2-cyclic phosphodiesterase